MDSDVKMIKAAASVVVTFLLAVTVLFGSWYTVPTGYVGVVSRNGAVVSTVEPGLGFKMPLVDTVQDISTQTNLRRYEGLSAYSSDQQVAKLMVSVNYRLDGTRAKEIVADLGGEEGVLVRMVDPRVASELKNVFGKYTAKSVIAERATFNQQVFEAIQASVSGPVIVESVQIEDVSFSDAYDASVEARMKAEVEVLTMKQTAEREKVQAQIVVTQAQADADARLAIAKSKAEATRLQGEAEAAAITARANALRDNANLVELTQAEKWDGKLPTTMVPSASVPFLSVK